MRCSRPVLFNGQFSVGYGPLRDVRFLSSGACQHQAGFDQNLPFDIRSRIADNAQFPSSALSSSRKLTNHQGLRHA
jgi:hypothetical protein